jgi:hypothetical protein
LRAHGWPIIDVTSRSIKETAGTITSTATWRGPERRHQLPAAQRMKRAALALAGCNHDSALAGLMLGETAVDAISRFVRGPDVATEEASLRLTA